MSGLTKHSTNKSLIAVILTVAMMVTAFFSSVIFTDKTVFADENFGYVTANYVNFRNAPWGSIIGTVDYGDIVTIYESVENGGKNWLHVSFDGQEGYLCADYVARVSLEEDPAFEKMISDFPDSYKGPLRLLHAIYPNYIFQADHIDTSFNALVNAQWRKTINAGRGDSWKALYEGNYDWSTGTFYYWDGGYTYASKETIAYYADPRNTLTADEIYSFLRQSATGKETEEALMDIVEGSFLEGTYVPKKGDTDDESCGGSYVKVIMKAAQVSGVSPYVLASTIIQEQGRYGCEMSWGTYSGAGGIYYGYYNFYNIATTGATITEVIENGLDYAVYKGWDNVYDAIVGGAQWYAEGYINNDQDTCYYKDFNVLNGPDYYWHQYSTAVFDHQNIGSILGSGLSNVKDGEYTFRIPVYEDMPDEAAPRPEESDKLNNYYFLNLSIDGYDLDFDMYENKYSVYSDSDITVKYTLPEGASYTGKSSYDVTSGTTKIALKVKSASGYTRKYYIYVESSEGCKVYVKDVAAKDEPSEEPATEPSTEPSTDNPQKEPDYKKGDPNNDGAVDIIDLALVKKQILGKIVLTGKQFDAADLNRDGVIDIIDLALVKKYILGKITSFD